MENRQLPFMQEAVFKFDFQTTITDEKGKPVICENSKHWDESDLQYDDDLEFFMEILEESATIEEAKNTLKKLMEEFRNEHN